MKTTTVRKPRTRPEPSRRNQQIFIEYELGGKTQEELAKDHGIKQCRVSQILRSVREWRSRVDPLLAGDLPNAQQKRLDAWLEHERLSIVEREAMRAFHREQRTITSRKEGDRDGKKYRETSEREQAASVQWLKAAMRATELKFKLQEERKWSSVDYDEQERERIAKDHWQRQRIDAEEQGRVPKSEYPWEVAQQWGKILGGYIPERQALAPGVIDLAWRVIRAAEGTEDAGQGTEDGERDVGCMSDSEMHRPGEGAFRSAHASMSAAENRRCASRLDAPMRKAILLD